MIESIVATAIGSFLGFGTMILVHIACEKYQESKKVQKK